MGAWGPCGRGKTFQGPRARASLGSWESLPCEALCGAPGKQRWMGPDFCLPERVKGTHIVEAVGVGVSVHSHAGVQNSWSVLQGTQKSLSEEGALTQGFRRASWARKDIPDKKNQVAGGGR